MKYFSTTDNTEGNIEVVSLLTCTKVMCLIYLLLLCYLLWNSCYTSFILFSTSSSALPTHAHFCFYNCEDPH